jgi:hypothetical protein
MTAGNLQSKNRYNKETVKLMIMSMMMTFGMSPDLSIIKDKILMTQLMKDLREHSLG